LLSYFRETDESPRKLTRLREEAYDIEVHRCGSDLECLIYEYRLIRKYTPPLNSQTEVNERKGRFAPMRDCIILLPHVQPDKGLSVWCRREQKIEMKPFAADFNEKEKLCGELEDFFFTQKLAAAKTDFAELEIVSRWFKRHRDMLYVVEVDRLSDARQVCDAMRVDWCERDSQKKSG
jgi:hypothetical protein